jgi:HAD superfamily hydrolase (TIGR01509 family)
MNEQIKLLIFDNDGVLIDSEILWHEACVAYFMQKGVHLTIEDSIDYFYLQQKNLISELMSEHHLSQIRQITEDSYSQKLKPILGMDLLLKHLNTTSYKICVASNADLDYIQHTLEITGLKTYFEPKHIFSADLVNKKKPAPNLFLYILNYFNLSPEECLVIEDHVLGMQAAKLAKIPVWGFSGGRLGNYQNYVKWLDSGKPAKLIQSTSELQDNLYE